MSSIKSHLSVISRQNQSFKNPSKLTNQTSITNNSLSLLNTLGSIDNNSAWNAKIFDNSNSSYKGNNQNSVDQHQLLNLSVTNGENITHDQISQIINYAKTIAFLAKQVQERKHLIVNKARFVKDLQNKINTIEQRAQFQQRQYKSKEKMLKSRSLSLSKHRKRVTQRFQTQISEMKVEIDWMKKTISSDKRKYYSRHSSIATERPKRQRVYIPMPYPQPKHFNPYPTSQRQSRMQEYLPPHPHRQINTQQLFNHRQKDHSISFWNQQRHEQPSISIRTPSNPTPSQNREKKGEGPGGILDLIQQKLQKGNKNEKGKGNGNVNKNRMQQSQRNPQAVQQSPQKDLGLVSKDSMNLHINISNQPNLEYLHDENSDIRNSQKSKKSIKNLKSSRGLVNKWKKDEQDHEIVQLLRESIEQKIKKNQQQKKTRYKTGQRSAIGAKLIVTDMGQNQPAIYVNKVELSRSKQKLNNLSDSEEKKHSNESGSRKTQNLMNSSIGIDLQDMSDSQEECQVKVDLKSKTPAKNFASTIKKQIRDQEEIQHSTTNYILITPLNNRNQPPKLLTPTNSTFQSIQKSAQATLPQTILSKPPSILQQGEEYYDDEIDSIKLATTSKHFDYQTPSKLIMKSQIKAQDEQQDFLGGIRLQTTSRISRQRTSHLSNSTQERIQQFLQSPSMIKAVTGSNLSKTVNEDDEIEMDGIDSELRKSTNSIFVKKGSSAIQKSINRNRNSHIEPSNKTYVPARSTSLLIGKSGGIANPIEEADEEEEEPSSIVRKHKKNK